MRAHGDVECDGRACPCAVARTLAPIDFPQARGEPALACVYEVSSAATALAEEIGARHRARGGAALVIDYGYAGHGFGETLQAVASSKFQDVLATPGEIDLSAHVDFAAFAACGAGAAARGFGPVEQGAFLKALGIGARARSCDPQSRRATTFDVDRLTKPEQMGTLFKALAILPPNAPTPPGF